MCVGNETITDHERKCEVEVRAQAYRAFIRRPNTVAETWSDEFEPTPHCSCDQIRADRRLAERHEQFARAAGRAIARRGY